MPLTFQIKRKSYIFSINDFLALLIIMANYINYYFDTLFPLSSLNRSLFLFSIGIDGSDCVAIRARGNNRLETFTQLADDDADFIKLC